MEQEFDGLTDREIVATINACLDALNDDRLRLPTDTDRLRLPTDTDRLTLLQDGIRVGAKLQAWQQQLAATIEQTGAAWNERKTSTRTWLAESMNLTKSEATRMIKAGQAMTRFTTIGTATLTGTVLPIQAEAITSVLAQLPKEFDDATIREAQHLMIGFAQTHNSTELRHLTSHLIDVLSPETADALDAKRLERQEKRAQSRRFLEYHNDGDGSVSIRGSLPVADAEPFIQLIDTYAAAAKRGIERLDPHTEHIAPAMRRADALVTMVGAHNRQAVAPKNGGDRPRIAITLSGDKLAKQCADAGLGATLISTGEPLPAGVARRLLCDADILPVVLGSKSEPLDVGRTQRLVTPAIRAALELRDQGCVFPGCNAPPGECEAHHVLPWYLGPTALSNLTLYCRHHHGIVEPSRDPNADRWKTVFRDDGIPTVIPPRRVDPNQRPRLHARFTTRPPDPPGGEPGASSG